LLMTEEALELPQIPDVLRQLEAQPPWSELPLILLTHGGESRLARLLNLVAAAAGSITLLERPLGEATLLRSIEVALRSRRRQYQVRDLLAQQRNFTEELERKVSERTQKLVSSQDRLRALATELNLAEQRERKRLATELHDHLAQMLVLVLLKLGQSKQGPLVRSQQMIQQAESLVNESLTYTRNLMAELSLPILREFGLFAALRSLSEQMQRYSLTVTVHTDSPEDVRLHEDQAVLLFQSVRELLINVAKHAVSKHASIRAEKREACLRIVVEDQGFGFDVLAMTSAKTSPLSSQFGLFSIRERMNVMGGRLEFHSAPGAGTRATLILPLAPRSQQALAQRTLKVSVPEAPAHRTSRLGHGLCRVLIADDHAMVRQGLRSMLEGYPDIDVIGEASNGQEAMAFTEQFKPAAVVMDINMPVMNGVEATATIRGRHPEIIVIGLSVNISLDNQEAMQKAGVSMLLTKEAAVEQLYGAIQQAMNGIVQSVIGA
jgi:signal transduction histidine kinase/ActR/RegA family two-component response regulator